ncbi:AV2 protein [Mesta yellow vein mosaic virus-[India:Bongaon:leaf curl:2007]]|nr:AV2 protein [Mesta yellow vein mosaic virus-[India:Bongaon:leaf curl:2007]]
MGIQLLKDSPETVHGFRCIFAINFFQQLSEEYSPDTVGYDQIRDLISILRPRIYVEASCRYRHFYPRVEGASSTELRQPLCNPCSCPHCPRHKVSYVGEQAHVSEAQNVQDVQKPRCS